MRAKVWQYYDVVTGVWRTDENAKNFKGCDIREIEIDYKYDREVPYNVNIEDLLTELLEYMKDREDADHDGERFVPNAEMKLAIDIRQALYQLERINP